MISRNARNQWNLLNSEANRWDQSFSPTMWRLAFACNWHREFLSKANMHYKFIYIIIYIHTCTKPLGIQKHQILLFDMITYLCLMPLLAFYSLYRIILQRSPFYLNLPCFHYFLVFHIAPWSPSVLPQFLSAPILKLYLHFLGLQVHLHVCFTRADMMIC